jgi:hypothetical protein
MKRAPNYLPEIGREGVQRACLDLLAAERIRHFRMNAGDTIGVGENGKRWRKRGHAKGTADVLMLVRRLVRFTNDSGNVVRCVAHVTEPVWLEFKSTQGTQRPEQIEFQKEAEANGEMYLLIRDPSELQAWLKDNQAQGAR